MTHVPRWSAPASFNHYGVFKLIVAVIMLNLSVGVIADGLFDANGCVVSETADTDYFPVKAFPENAETAGWSVTYENTYKVLTNSHVGATYILWQCGTTQPTLTSEYPEATYFQIPVSKVGITTTTQITYLEMLGERESIKATIDDYGNTWPAVSSPCLLDLMERDLVKDLNTTSFLDEDLDLVLYGGFGTSFDSIDYKVAATEFNVKNPVEIAEWLKLYSLFFNKEAKAIDHMMDVAERYACHAKYVEDTVTQVDEAPKVMWAYESWGSWYAGGEDAYYTQLIENAGGDYMYVPPGTGYYGAMTNEELLANAAKADIWMYAGDSWDSMLAGNATLRELILALPVAVNERVFDFTGQGKDWFESRYAEPDVVLEDFITVIQPTVHINHERVWWRNVFTETAMDRDTAASGECADTGAAHEIVADICPFDEIANVATTRGPAGILTSTVLFVLPFALFLAF